MADCRIVGLAVAPLVVRAVVDLCTRGCCCVSVRRRMACLTRAESSSCSTGGTLASLYRAGSGVVFHTGKHPLRAWLTAFWIRLIECWRPVRTVGTVLPSSQMRTLFDRGTTLRRQTGPLG